MPDVVLKLYPGFVLDTAAVTGFIPTSEKGAPGGVATLDGDGVIPIAQLPPLAINTVTPVASEAAMLALVAERGDMAIRTDESNQWYVLAADDPTDVDNWLPIQVSTVVGGGATRTTTTISGSVAANSQLTGSTAIAKGAVLFGMRESSGRACRVRLYGTAAARDADLARDTLTTAVSGSYPAGTGLTCDVVLGTDTLATLDLDPKPVLGNPTDPPITTVYWTLDNYSSALIPLAVDLRHTPFET